MGHTIFLIIFLPLILLALGFFILCLRWFLTRNQRADNAKLVDLTIKLDARLDKLETRITALEDILLNFQDQPSIDKKIREFDKQLNQPKNS
ncbi:MAG: hypothetical protein LBE31_02335 [Deltaproteobacteria bacterium]|jgi:cell division protein FtsB|nr:hypothetical protein [Deltaproteobacteria bacterium]